MRKYITSWNESIPEDEESKYEHCFLCDRIGLNILYQPNEMAYHPQSGDRCCQHCADTIIFEKCKYCEHLDVDDCCLAKCEHVERDEWCEGFTKKD